MCNDDYIACGDTLCKMLTKSKNEMESMEPNNKIVPISKYDCYTASNVINEGGLSTFQSMFPDYPISLTQGILTRRQVYAMNNLYNTNCNKEIELIGQIPSAFFKSERPIDANTKITTKYVIDNIAYHTNLINYAGSFKSGYSTPSIVQMSSKDSQLADANCIGVGVLDKFCYYMLSHLKMSQVKSLLVIL